MLAETTRWRTLASEPEGVLFVSLVPISSFPLVSKTQLLNSVSDRGYLALLGIEVQIDLFLAVLRVGRGGSVLSSIIEFRSILVLLDEADSGSVGFRL